jgi:hypothetical protein
LRERFGEAMPEEWVTLDSGNVTDKREFPRYQIRIGARYELLSGPPAERPQISETADVGLRGCKLVTGSRTELAGTRLVVCPLLPSGHRVRIARTIACGLVDPTRPAPAWRRCCTFDLSSAISAHSWMHMLGA